MQFGECVWCGGGSGVGGGGGAVAERGRRVEAAACEKCYVSAASRPISEVDVRRTTAKTVMILSERPIEAVSGVRVSLFASVCCSQSSCSVSTWSSQLVTRLKTSSGGKQAKKQNLTNLVPTCHFKNYVFFSLYTLSFRYDFFPSIKKKEEE